MWDKYLWWGGKPNGDAGEMLIVVKNLQLKADYEDNVVANHNVDGEGTIAWRAKNSCNILARNLELYSSPDFTLRR